MKKLINSFIVAVLSFAFTQISFAVCVEGPANNFTCNTNPPNPDLMGVQQGGNGANLQITVLPGAAINTAGQPGDLDGIEVGDGNNRIDITGASVIVQDDGILTGDGNNVINVYGSLIETTDIGDPDAIDTGDGNDIINIIGNSTLISIDDDAITSSRGNDQIFISDSELTAGQISGNNFAVSAGPGDDMITVRDSTLRSGPTGAASIRASNGNDTIIIEGVGATLIDQIDCGSEFDTIEFAMAVPATEIGAACAAIESADPQAGSITINGLFYQWEDCEQLVCDLQIAPIAPTSTPTAIPTLNEWGLIALIISLGIIVGVLVYRRRLARS